MLGVGISYVSTKEVLEYIVKSIKKGREKYYIVTPNPEMIVLANRDDKFKKALNSAKIALPDGVGVVLASKILGVSLKERVTGVDLIDRLCREVSKRPITVGFLGGGPGVAVKTSECLKNKYPSLRVGFAGEKWEVSREMRAGGRENSSSSALPNPILTSHPHIDILFVALGFPKQELWIAKNLSKLPVKVAMGVGGAFDFISGEVPRAPRWLQKIGLEWLFRLIIQPWRIKRQLRLLKFIYLVLKQSLLSTT